MATPQRTSDVIIIGGGIIGLTVAWRFAREGLSVVLLEKGRLGREASWAAAGVLAAGNWQRRDPLVEFQRKSLRMYPSFCAELVDASGIDPEYINCGSVELLLDEQKFRMAQAEVDAARGFLDAKGEPVLRLLSPREAAEIEPRLTSEILGAKLCAFNSQVRNPRLLRALAAAAQRAGAVLREGCPATALRREGDHIIGAASTEGEFRAPHTLLCAGAWSSLLDEPLAQRVRVYPVRGQIALLQAAPGLLTHIVKHRKSYLVPRCDGLVVAGSTEEHDSGFASATTAEGLGRILAMAQRMSPPLASARFVQGWAGLRPGTPDRRPYIGAVPGSEGLLVAAGHFRTGLGLAPLTAEIVADLVLRGRTEHEVAAFRADRVSPHPEEHAE